MTLKTVALMAGMIAALAAPLAAQAQPKPLAPLDIAALRQATAGQWQGKLEYRDYQSDRWFGLPVIVQVEAVGDGVTLIRKAAFDDGPKTGTVWITTVELLDPATGVETASSFRKGRKPDLASTTLSLAAPAADLTHWTMVSESDGRDADRPARLRLTTVRDGAVMTTLKEIDFLDDAGQAWLQRNRTTLTQVAAKP